MCRYESSEAELFNNEPGRAGRHGLAGLRGGEQLITGHSLGHRIALLHTYSTRLRDGNKAVSDRLCEGLSYLLVRYIKEFVEGVGLAPQPGVGAWRLVLVTFLLKLTWYIVIASRI